MGSVQAQWERMWLANPPWWPMMVACDFGAEMLAAGHAVSAVEAAARVPADADALADGESFHRGAEGDDAADGFVAEDGGVRRAMPVVVEDGEIGVADAAVFDLDLDFFGRERAEVDLLADDFLFSGGGDPSVDACHGSSSGAGGACGEVHAASAIVCRRSFLPVISRTRWSCHRGEMARVPQVLLAWQAELAPICRFPPHRWLG